MSRPTYNGMTVDEFARNYVRGNIDRGMTIEQLMYGQTAMCGPDIRFQVGGRRAWNWDWSEPLTNVKSDEMFVMIGDEWRVFSLRKLYADVEAGAPIQAALL